ncbi:hypothetical protein JKG47_12605 [Acidithiobacillus sp. MC6.1]|nr:hypothetical protein [Acidithiobacillus sp. MC6.1]
MARCFLHRTLFSLHPPRHERPQVAVSGFIQVVMWGWEKEVWRIHPLSFSYPQIPPATAGRCTGMMIWIWIWIRK